MNKYALIRQSAYDANMQLPRLGLVLFTFGNVSAADRNLGVFAIKPSGLPYEELTPDKMVVVDFEGKTVEGDLRPSSDTLSHAVLYKEWPLIGELFIPIPLMLLPGRKVYGIYPFMEPRTPITWLVMYPVPHPWRRPRYMEITNMKPGTRLSDACGIRE